MSEFNEHNWQEALSSLYARSLTDPTYRNLCLSDPAAAIKAVSEIELPSELKFQFFETSADMVYPYLLPPLPDPRLSGGDQAAQLIRWATICSIPTTFGPA